MRKDRARRRVVLLIAGLLTLSCAAPAAAAEHDPPITEVVPVRVHGRDTNWPPVLVFFALLIVGGGILVCIVFMRRARGETRPRGTIR